MSESTTPSTAQTIARNHNPSPNGVYRDSRTDDLLRLIYIDEFVAFLRVDQQTRREGDGWIHRMDTRPDFDDQLENGRLTPAPDAEIEAPPADYDLPEDVDGVEAGDDPRRSDGTASIRETDWDKYASGESSSTECEPSDGDASADTTESESTTDTPDDEPVEDQSTADHEKWSEVPHIGEKTESNLYDHGFETVEDIRQADTADLEAVPHLGPAGIDNLRAEVD